VAAQVRATFPQFCGISGSTSTTFSTGLHLDVSSEMQQNIRSLFAFLLYVKLSGKSI
jgi:hypothetical protein